jgi:hypothetical protein
MSDEKSSLADEFKQTADAKNIEKHNSSTNQIVAQIVNFCRWASKDGRYEERLSERVVGLTEENRTGYLSTIEADLKSYGFQVTFIGSVPFREILINWG